MPRPARSPLAADTRSKDESSPVVVSGVVYGGNWSGQVYALDAETGKPRWTYQTDGEVKGSAAVAGGRVYIGSYDGHVYALDARGREVPLARVLAELVLGTQGRFYSTPAVAYGRDLHRLHRRQGVLVRCGQREAPLVDLHGQLRLRVACDLADSSP